MTIIEFDKFSQTTEISTEDEISAKMKKMILLLKQEVISVLGEGTSFDDRVDAVTLVSVAMLRSSEDLIIELSDRFSTEIKIKLLALAQRIEKNNVDIIVSLSQILRDIREKRKNELFLEDSVIIPFSQIAEKYVPVCASS